MAEVQRREAPATSHGPGVGRPRVAELDALRGVAAATVVAWHSLLIFPRTSQNTRHQGVGVWNVLNYSPLHGLFAGPQAVMIFFVISGFVLALPFIEGRWPDYRGFVVRRVARIWPTYAVACVLAFLAAGLIGGGSDAGLSEWFYAKWRDPVTPLVVIQHLSLIGQFPAGRYDPAIWSLVHEMRISLLFPLLVLLVLHARPWLVLAGTSVWTAAMIQLPVGSADGTSMALTLEYLGYFAIGIALARQRLALVGWLRQGSAGRRVALPAAACLLYTYPWWVPDGYGLHIYTADVLSVMAGSALIVLLALTSPRLGKLLRTRPLQFLGRISYSLYLVHAIVILALVHLLYGRVSTILILLCVWPVALGLASLSEAFIERPSIVVGRRLARRWSAGPAGASDDGGGRGGEIRGSQPRPLDARDHVRSSVATASVSPVSPEGGAG